MKLTIEKVKEGVKVDFVKDGSSKPESVIFKFSEIDSILKLLQANTNSSFKFTWEQ